MLFIFHGSSEIGARVRSTLCYLTYLRHLIGSKALTNQIFFSKIPIFFMLSNCSELPSNTGNTIYAVDNISVVNDHLPEGVGHGF